MGDKKITVNCIAPGGIKTDMYHKVCREYIPNGENMNDDQVDEVSTLDLCFCLREAEYAAVR
jgi:NAD(P)-dependent dehydrogenase (short-subunit alcohol dehydrogenase family)